MRLPDPHGYRCVRVWQTASASSASSRRRTRPTRSAKLDRGELGHLRVLVPSLRRAVEPHHGDERAGRVPPDGSVTLPQELAARAAVVRTIIANCSASTPWTSSRGGRGAIPRDARGEQLMAARKTRRDLTGSGRRGGYGHPQGGRAQGCLFTAALSALRRPTAATRARARRPHALLMALNQYPYNLAHLMVAPALPRGPVPRADRRGSELTCSTHGARRARSPTEYGLHGSNYGSQRRMGRGAGFPGHLHLHLVPRWNGDTNFMPTVGETACCPSRPETWKRSGTRWQTPSRARRGTKRGAKA